MILNEFQHIVGDEILMVYSSLYIERLVQADFDRAIAKLDEAVGHMIEGEVDSILVGGGPVVMALGSDEAVVDRTRALTDVPSNSTTGAMLAGMNQLGAKRLVVATPYTDERNALLKQYLEKMGYSVVAMSGLGYTRAMDIARLPFGATYEHACATAELAINGADAVYMPCARMPVVRNIASIEQTTGLPVVTSTQAMVWWGLRSIGITDPMDGFGRLLREPMN